MTTNQFKNMCYRALETMRGLAPYKTGNLARNAVRMYFISEDTAVLYVNTVIAPYMPYTNEPWISPRWNGKKNPNEGWFDGAVRIITEQVSEELNGEIEEDED